MAEKQSGTSHCRECTNCPLFEAHFWRSQVCRNCSHNRLKHHSSTPHQTATSSQARKKSSDGSVRITHIRHTHREQLYASDNTHNSGDCQHHLNRISAEVASLREAFSSSNETRTCEIRQLRETTALEFERILQALVQLQQNFQEMAARQTRFEKENEELRAKLHAYEEIAKATQTSELQPASDSRSDLRRAVSRFHSISVIKAAPYQCSAELSYASLPLGSDVVSRSAPSGVDTIDSSSSTSSPSSFPSNASEQANYSDTSTAPTTTKLSEALVRVEDVEVHVRTAESGDESTPNTPGRSALTESRLARMVKEAMAKLNIDTTPHNPTRKASYDEQRKYIAKEIVTKERNYVRYLAQAIEYFLDPLRQALANARPIVSREDIAAMFHQMEGIYELNKAFLNRLEQRMDQWAATDDPGQWLIGDLFVDMIDHLRQYSAYVANYDIATETYQRCLREVPGFAKLVADVDIRQQMGNLSLQDVLVMPVATIPRYRLLLEELLQKTEPSHKDFENLRRAVDMLHELLMHHERLVERSAAIARYSAVVKRFVNRHQLDDSKQGRFVVREGELALVHKGKKFFSSDGGTSASARLTLHCHVFLFNDSMVIAKHKRKRGTVTSASGPAALADEIPMEIVVFIGSLSGSTTVKVEDRSNGKQLDNLFQISGVPGAKYPVVLRASSSEEKLEWVEALNKVIAGQYEAEVGLMAFA